jgi:hypothetical protein
VAKLANTDVNSPEFKELLVRLYQNLNRMALVVNAKETGVYNNAFSTPTSQQWFPNPSFNSTTAQIATLRPTDRTVINFGPLPSAGDGFVRQVPHNITCTAATTFTRIYAMASDTTGKHYIPIPYVDVTNTNPVQIDVDATYVTITTLTDLSTYNICYVVLEYLQT